MKNNKIAAVVIGRNEGSRLITGLNSLARYIDCIVYVDSGSTDASVSDAHLLGVKCLSLDLGIAFTAARARNAGAKYINDNHPEIEFIQFMDGDCEIQAGWLDSAYQFLVNNEQYAVACGRRRERFPEQSVYNQLCDIEWSTPVGETHSCGGDALIRVFAFKQVGGYNSSLIAGEEPEMCFRLRFQGWKVYRLDVEMTLHDAAIVKFSQWWKRSVRAGYSYTLGSSIHGDSKERYWVHEKRRIIIWGIFLPILIVISAVIKGHFFLLFLVYPIQILRLALRNKQFNKHRLSWAIAMVIGKFAEAQGLIKFYFDKYRNTTSTIIEYKR